MVYRLGISLTTFKDLTSPSGEILTTYVIRVMYNSDQVSKMVYEVEKRYSEFKNLHLAVKDVIPADYKFPNKSIFNNSAQFTKERRMRGFEELLHHMQREESVRDELHTFLELDYNLAKYRAKNGTVNQIRAVSAVSTISAQSENDLSTASSAASGSHYDPLPTHFHALAAKKDQLNTTTGLPDELRVRKSLQAVSQYLINKENEAEEHFNESSSSNQPKELTVEEALRQNPKPFLFFAAKVSVVTYVIVVLLGIVDISNSALSQIILTLLALFLLVLLLRIRHERHAILTADKQNKKTTNESLKNKLD